MALLLFYYYYNYYYYSLILYLIKEIFIPMLNQISKRSLLNGILCKGFYLELLIKLSFSHLMSNDFSLITDYRILFVQNSLIIFFLHINDKRSLKMFSEVM